MTEVPGGEQFGSGLHLDMTRQVVTARFVWSRRLLGVLAVAMPLAWAIHRAVPADGDLLNRGGVPLLVDLLASVLRPSVDQSFLRLVLEATGITLTFAALGTVGALVIGLLGGCVLSNVVWNLCPPWPVRIIRLLLRGLLVMVRSVHELVWALLLISILGLDPLVAVLAIALPFGAQTAQVFAQTFDGVPPGPLQSVRISGAPSSTALAYALLPAAAPLLLSYSFYRFECAVRSTVLLGTVGIGGLGQALTVSLQSRNWDEVWTLVGVVVLLSALIDLWSTRVRSDLAVVTCSDWSVGAKQRSGGRHTGRRTAPARGTGSRWVRYSAVAVVLGVMLAWLTSNISLRGLTDGRTVLLTRRLLRDLWPAELPPGGWPTIVEATLDSLAMTLVAMALAVAITLSLGPWATSQRPGSVDAARATVRWLRGTICWFARLLLLVLRSVPPSLWAVFALFPLFPGVLPGALALGLYTGGIILGRLVAEAWESIDTRARSNLRQAGVTPLLAAAAAIVPPSAGQLLVYTLYRFEICVRDTAVVGIVGATGLGRLLAENLAVFRFPAVTTLLTVSCLVSITTEAIGRRLRHELRT